MGDHLPSVNHGSHNLDQAYPSFLIDNYYCTGTQNLLKHFTIRHYNWDQIQKIIPIDTTLINILTDNYYCTGKPAAQLRPMRWEADAT